MSTENKRIKQRHGTYTELQNAQLLPDEFAIADSGAPTTSGTAVFYKNSGNIVTQLRNQDDPIIIGEGAVDTSELANGAVTENKLAGRSVYGRHIALGTVAEENLGPRCVTAGKIGLGTITQDNLDDQCVGNLQIIDGEISMGKLATQIQNKINNALPSTTAANTYSLLLPTKTNLSDLSDLKNGQLFLYGNELLRKTPSGYYYVKTIYTTGGTGIETATPKYIGETILFNNNIYFGKNTQSGGYKQIPTVGDISFIVNLTADGDNYLADKTVIQIYSAIQNNKNIIAVLHSDDVYQRFIIDYANIISSAAGIYFIHMFSQYMGTLEYGATGSDSNAVFEPYSV